MQYEVVVQKKDTRNPYVVLLYLVPVHATLSHWDAGSHIDLHLPNGLIRQYSLLPTTAGQYAIAVQRDNQSRGGSTWIHDALQEGDTLRISPPKNLFPLHPDAAHSLLIGGGIGITPLISMAAALSAKGNDFSLHYCCKSVVDAAFLEQIQAMSWHASLYTHFSDDGSRMDIHARMLELQPNDHVYVCGPVQMIQTVQSAAAALGIVPGRIHIETFVAMSDSNAVAADNQAFELVLAGSNKQIQVNADETVLEALEREGVDHPYACREGFCGTCLTDVQEGVVDHRDSFLSEEERAANTQFIPCCSRAANGKLVIDV